MESAIYSNQGDEYQRLIALHWVVRLLCEDDLDWVQIEAIASPDTQERILVEDIVVSHKDGHKVYIRQRKTSLTIERGVYPTSKICSSEWN